MTEKEYWKMCWKVFSYCGFSKYGEKLNWVDKNDIYDMPSAITDEFINMHLQKTEDSIVDKNYLILKIISFPNVPIESNYFLSFLLYNSLRNKRALTLFTREHKKYARTYIGLQQTNDYFGLKPLFDYYSSTVLDSFAERIETKQKVAELNSIEYSRLAELYPKAYKFFELKCEQHARIKT